MVDIFRGESVGEIVSGGPAEFAAAVIGLLRDKQRRHYMGRAGHDLVCRSYSLAAMGQRYLDFYRQLLSNAGDVS